MEGREGTAPVQKEALCPHQEALSPPEALCLLQEALSPPKEASSPPEEAVAQLPLTDQSQRSSRSLERRASDAPTAIGSRTEKAASAAPGGNAGSAQVAVARSPVKATDDRDDHGIAVDCGEPWHRESRKMAAALGSVLNAPELHPALSSCTLFEELSNAEDEADAHDPQEDFQSSEQDVQEDFKASEQNALQVAPELDFFKNRCAFLITELTEVVRAQGEKIAGLDASSAT